MNRISLTDSSFEALLRLADTYGVDVPAEADRATLEELISDAFDEWEQEHRRANNHSVRIEETKYEVQAEKVDRPPDLSAEDVELPASYNETRVVVMLRDPAWAFAYWDLREADAEAFAKSELFEGLALRVFAMSNADTDEGSVSDVTDIPVTLIDTSWYIHLPEQERFYRIGLVAFQGGAEQLLAVSNVVAVPRGAVADGSVIGHDAGDEILAQTGIQDLDVPPEGKRIPQRILDLIDEELLFS